MLYNERWNGFESNYIIMKSLGFIHEAIRAEGFVVIEKVYTTMKQKDQFPGNRWLFHRLYNESNFTFYADKNFALNAAKTSKFSEWGVFL